MRSACRASTFPIAIGKLESSLLGDIVWNNDGEGLHEEDSPCGIGLIIRFSCWEVIRGGGGDGPGELGCWEEFGLFGDVGNSVRSRIHKALN